jgi:hypothetical protein
MTSATTWPVAEVELVRAWHPLWAVVHVLLVVLVPAGGPRAPFAPPAARVPSVPVAEERTVPVQPVLPAQSSVASAIDHDDAPGTVGPPVLALEPGAVGAGGVAGWSWPGVLSCWS